MKSVVNVFDKVTVKKKIIKLRKLMESEIERKTGCVVTEFSETKTKGIERVNAISPRPPYGFRDIGDMRFRFIDNGKTVTISFEFTSN